MSKPSFRDRLTLRFMRQVVETPQGRAHMLNQITDAEDNGESQVFTRVLARLDDPELAQLVAKHQADEVRHAALFAARRDATGVSIDPVPQHLRLIDRLDAKVGGMMDRPIETREDVMNAYVLLQVVEERAITQFQMFEDAFRPIDPETADVFVEVAKDEERHLKYCQAIAKRYAPSEEVRLATLTRYRELEAEAFKENGSANMNHSIERGYLDGHPVWKRIWLLLDRGAKRSSARPYTHFHLARNAT